MPFDTTPREEPRNKVVGHLRAARDLIAREGLWCKGKWRENRVTVIRESYYTNIVTQPASCAADALHVAMYGIGYQAKVGELCGLGVNAERARRRVHRYHIDWCATPEAQAVGWQVPVERLRENKEYDHIARIVDFNDHKETTLEDVLALFDRAIQSVKVITALDRQV